MIRLCTLKGKGKRILVDGIYGGDIRNGGDSKRSGHVEYAAGIFSHDDPGEAGY